MDEGSSHRKRQVGLDSLRRRGHGTAQLGGGRQSRTNCSFFLYLRLCLHDWHPAATPPHTHFPPSPHLVPFILCGKGVPVPDPSQRKAGVHRRDLAKVPPGLLKLPGAHVVAGHCIPGDGLHTGEHKKGAMTSLTGDVKNQIRHMHTHQYATQL